jgi:hypothetical protein
MACSSLTILLALAVEPTSNKGRMTKISVQGNLSFDAKEGNLRKYPHPIRQECGTNLVP